MGDGVYKLSIVSREYHGLYNGTGITLCPGGVGRLKARLIAYLVMIAA